MSKVTSVNDLTDNLTDKMSLLLKLPNYHERWSDLSIKDFQNVNSYNKGSEVKIKVTPFTDSISNESVAPSDTALKYLEKAIQLCQSKGIDVLLTYIPYVEGKNYDNIETIAEKYSINYLNMFNTADIINYGTDFFDEHGHLNASGAYKMSSYLGKYIMENYNIQDRRNDKSYNKWKSDYEDYVKNNIYRLNHVNNVYSYIMLLTNQEFECKITVRNEITLNSYPLIYELINNIDGIIKCDDTYMGNNTVYSNLTDNSKAFSKEEVLNDINITVYRRGTEEIISHVDFDI